MFASRTYGTDRHLSSLLAMKNTTIKDRMIVKHVWDFK
jgi:hypothetical protein